MSQVSIHIRIGQREYPMKVLAKEEQMLRESAQRLSEQLQLYVKQFDLRDYQDVLAMVAFDLAVESTRRGVIRHREDQGLHDQVQRIQEQVDETLHWVPENGRDDAG